MTQVIRTSDTEDCNTSGNPCLNDVLEARLSRRNLLRVSMGTAGAAVLGSVSLTACGGSDSTEPARPLALGFNSVPKSTADVLTVPSGYTATVLYALGDPLTA